MTDILEKLHDQGYIHCDLSPENFMMGDRSIDSRNCKKLHLIDFGLSHSFVDKNGEHMPEHNTEYFKGSRLYASKNAFRRKFLSRKDDIISMMYLIITLISPKLQWARYDAKKISKFKRKSEPKKLLDNDTLFLLPLLEHSYDIDFS